MAKHTVAVIGCGTIANNAHIPCYSKNPDVKIKYLCDIIPEKAQAAVEKFGCGTAITDYHDILNDPEVDAVSICTPNKLHTTIAIDCLRAGKNVLSEKPAARTYEEALEMQRVQHETGKVLNIGVVNRFDKHVNLIKNYIDDGRLGKVHHVYISFRDYRTLPGLGSWFTTKDISGGGVLIDWGVHFIDLVMYCCGSPKPITVTGETFCKLGKNMEDYAYLNMWAGPPTYNGTYDVEDSITGMIRTDGPVISFNGAWAQNINHNEMYIDFMGDKGGIRLSYLGDFTYYSFSHGALEEFKPSLRQDEGSFQKEIDAFLRCTETGEKLPSHIDNVVVTAQIMQAIYDSADSHREITL